MSKRFLLIEDDQGCGAILSRVLLSTDPEAVVESEDRAEDALEALKKNKRSGRVYDLIVADIFLAGPVTGLDFWNKCRDEHPEIPILFVSSLPVNRFFDSIGRNVIAPPFLPKPFGAGEAKQMIEGLLRYH